MTDETVRKNLRILRRPSVEARTGLRRSAIYEGVNNGTFPPPVRLGPKAVGWLEHEIESWIADRVSERDRSEVDQWASPDSNIE